MERSKLVTRKWFVVFALWMLQVSSGCQKESLSPTPVEHESSTAVLLLETPSAKPTLDTPTAELLKETPTAEPLIDIATPTILESSITVPQGLAPAIDGTISPGEWEAAEVELFTDGSELYLMYGEGYLYLAVRANTQELIVVNVFIQRGKDIEILHTSAALGTAIYRKGATGWQQVQGFNWRCRKTDHSSAAQAERDAFLEQEHWVGANTYMGEPNEMEYQIELLDEPSAPGGDLHQCIEFKPAHPLA